MSPLQTLNSFPQSALGLNRRLKGTAGFNKHIHLSPVGARIGLAVNGMKDGYKQFRSRELKHLHEDISQSSQLSTVAVRINIRLHS